MSSEIEKCHSRVQALCEQRKLIQSALAEASQRIGALQAELKQKSDELYLAGQSIDQMEDREFAAELSAAGAHALVTKRESQLAAAEAKVGALQTDNEELRGAYDEWMKQREALQADLQAERDKHDEEAYNDMKAAKEAAEAKVEALTAALERTREYIRIAMRPQSVAAACCETAWDRAERSGLKHALNAINAEFTKAEQPANHREQAQLIAEGRPSWQPRVEQCVWNQDDVGGDDIWETTCNHNFYFDGDGGPLSHGLKWCGFCGKSLAESRTSDSAPAAPPEPLMAQLQKSLGIQKP